jgi:Asp-tRNA(Asn)/Glu-tRNA(Gln) amidotransferase A subunit family amidase
VENILAGKWTASAVLEAYIARAAQAQEAMNCLTEGTYRLCLDYLDSVVVLMLGSVWCTGRIVFFEEAIQDARKLDDEFAATGSLKGPLHGVPISVKDQCTFSLTLISFSG